MKLIFLYGAPGVGKLTVASEISRASDFKVFHNHLAIDCITPIFEFGTPSFHKLVELIRIETVAEAAKAEQDLVYTFCYAKDRDDTHVEKIVSAVKSHGGTIYFVLLRADVETLKRRILDVSRAKYGKVRSIELLERLLNAYDLFSPVNEYAGLEIDNTTLSPTDTAALIINFVNH
jgi:broad-specificity NMP kinase